MPVDNIEVLPPTERHQQGDEAERSNDAFMVLFSKNASAIKPEND